MRDVDHSRRRGTSGTDVNRARVEELILGRRSKEGGRFYNEEGVERAAIARASLLAERNFLNSCQDSINATY